MIAPRKTETGRHRRPQPGPLVLVKWLEPTQQKGNVMARKRSTESGVTVSSGGTAAAAAPARRQRTPRTKPADATQLAAPQAISPDAPADPLDPLSLGSVSPVSEPEQPVLDSVTERAEVEQLAYSLWEARGCPPGSAEEDWFRAEEEIRRRRALGAE